MIIEEASPEFLLDQVHIDIQYPHEEEAFHIFQKIQIFQQQGRMRQCHTLYKRLGKFYQKQARVFSKRTFANLSPTVIRAPNSLPVGGSTDSPEERQNAVFATLALDVNLNSNARGRSWKILYLAASFIICKSTTLGRRCTEWQLLLFHAVRVRP